MTAPERDAQVVAEALAEVSAALNSTLELDAVLDLILDRAARVVPYSDGTVLLIEGDDVEVVRARGYDDSMIGVRFATPPFMQRIIDTQEPFVVEDTLKAPDWIVAEGGENIRSAALVGIRADGRVVGFITLDSNETGSFTLEQAGRLQVFADQAGNAIRNARLYREAEQARGEAEAALASMREQRRLTKILSDISAELTVQRDVDDLLDFIIERVSAFVSGASVSVLMIEGEKAEVVRTTRGDEATRGKKLTIAETSLRQVIETQRPHLIEDTEAAGSEWVKSDDIAWIRSNLTSPIMLGNDVIGFLSLSSGEPDAFPRALFQPLETFSNQVGVAIQNARIFAESQTARSAEQEERLLARVLGEISAALNSTLELDDVLDMILDRLAQVISFTTGTILMFDGGHAEIVRAKGFDSPIVGERMALTEASNLQRVAATGEPSLIRDTRSSPDWISTPQTDHIRSAMTAPIKADGQVVGAISVDSEQVDAFSAEQVKRLVAFADQTGSAVRNARLYQDSQEARNQSDQLLRAILPEQIATELKANGRVRARRHEDVAVLFADIVGFTHYSDTRDPEDVLDALTEIAKMFEEVADDHGLEKLKTIGDSFMAASGLLSPVLNPDLQCVKAGLAMIEACKKLESKWTVRVGIHSGELVAGVLGTEKFLFDVWGDTVNTASRIESNGVPNEVAVSRTSWDRIAHACVGRSRGAVPIKGKGEMEMFVVEGLR